MLTEVYVLMNSNREIGLLHKVWSLKFPIFFFPFLKYQVSLWCISLPCSFSLALISKRVSWQSVPLDFFYPIISSLCFYFWIDLHDIVKYIFGLCSGFHIVALIRAYQLKTWRGKGLFHLTNPRSQSHTEGSQNRDSRRKDGCLNWSRDHGEMVLTGSVLLLTQLPDTTKDHLHLRGGRVHNDLGTPVSIIDQDTAPQICPQDNLVVVITPLRFSLPVVFNFCRFAENWPV